MIITVPESKRIFNIKRQNKLNESSGLFDDDIFTNDEYDGITIRSNKEYEETEEAPKVELLLNLLNVENYEIKCTGFGIIVDVHDNLYLSNMHLDRFNFKIFKFGVVDGSCNYTGNKLTDWSKFPKVIKGNCYANFNNITSFDGVPTILGTLVASKQNHKTRYPLTDDNYRKFSNNSLDENSVYTISTNRFGKIYSICESDNSCIIKFDDNTRQKFSLNDVEYLGNIENIFIS